MAEILKRLRFVIIGAGMAGMLAGIRLKERGDHDFTIYEKGDGVGGTWRENHYPGLACDTPAHSYTYSFATNPEWSAFYAPGPEIRAYFEGVADRYDLKSQIQFNSEIVSCRFVGGRWRIATSDGREDVADVVIAATGVLHHPNVPDIPGLKDFAGPVFHSARWDHTVPLEGKRVGVIGNGSTGVQIVSAVSKIAGKLTHFLRSPQWIMPCLDLKYSEEDKAAFRDDPAKIEEVRNGPEAAPVLPRRSSTWTRLSLKRSRPFANEIWRRVSAIRSYAKSSVPITVRRASAWCSLHIIMMRCSGPMSTSRQERLNALRRMASG